MKIKKIIESHLVSRGRLFFVDLEKMDQRNIHKYGVQIETKNYLDNFKKTLDSIININDRKIAESYDGSN